MPKTLAIMPVFMNTPEDLLVTQKAIETLKGTCDADLMVIDDYSPDRESAANLLRWQEESKLTFELFLKSENEGFSKTINIGMHEAHARKQNALLVNADVEFFQADWLAPMEENPADVVGALLLFPNGLVQHAGIFFSVINRIPDHIYRMAPHSLKEVHEPRTCPVTGALMLVKNATMDKIGYLDEQFGMGFEDVDYCYTAFRAGLTCAYEPRAQAIHHESIFRHQVNDKKHSDRWNKAWELLHTKHGGWEFADFVPTLLWDEEDG